MRSPVVTPDPSADLRVIPSERAVGPVTHGATVTTLTDGKRTLACRCRAVVHEDSWWTHIATHRRESVVFRASLASNVEGMAFQHAEVRNYKRRQKRAA